MSNNRGPVDGVHDEGGKLDAAIDRAVRRMMAAEPPPGLRHRVARRLKDSDNASWKFLPRFALAGAALAVIILGVSMMRPSVTVAPPPQQSAAATTPPAPVAEPPSAVEAPVEAVAAPPVAAARPRQDPLPEPPGMADVFGAPDTRVTATSVAGVPLDDPRTPETEPGTTFRSPLAGLAPTRLEDLGIPLVQIAPPRTIPR